nr:hypothetical protein [Shewanella baltica]
MPWEDALIFAVNTLNAYKLKKDIKVITATKIFTLLICLKPFVLALMCVIPLGV